MESVRQKRIKKILQLYYSRPEVQKAILEFSQNREIAPSYMMESFGKRPDSLQYVSEIFEMVKKGATSFHSSQELWEDPLRISTDMNQKQANELRIGWDLLLDIDSKYLDYSKILAEQIIKVFKFHGVKNFSIKFSGSKGFHIIVPWQAFPKKVGDLKTSDMFPEWPRIITKYLMDKTENPLRRKITDLTRANKYVIDKEASKEVVPDLILVSSRHLFRMPYSLHEKTALASVVLDPKKISEFQPKDADPMTVKVINFLPQAEEGEASELLREALDWYKNINPEESQEKRNFEFKPIKLTNLSEKNFPPSIKKILQGVSDGRKRGLFIILNFFRSVGMENEELEQRIEEWNKKNEIALQKGYIQSQLSWAYRHNPVLPPNYLKDYYKGIGIIPTEEELRYKNPVTYTIKKTLQQNKQTSPKKSKKNK